MSLASQPKTKRNAAIVRAFESGATYDQLAARFALSKGRVCTLVHRFAGDATHAELLRRQDGRGGRQTIWPDCPAHLRERYQKTKKRIGARAAKEQIIRQERLKAQIAAQGPLAMVA
jgi:hypothetical protein